MLAKFDTLGRLVTAPSVMGTLGDLANLPLLALAPATWQASTQGNGPTVNLFISAVAGQSLYVCGLFVNSTNMVGDWYLQFGATQVLNSFNKLNAPVLFVQPLKAPVATQVQLTWENGGTDYGRLSIWGFTGL